MTLPPQLSFTLREEGARSGYSVAAGADRLRHAVSFDEEDDGDLASVIAPFSLADLSRRNRARTPEPTPVAAPVAAYDDDEVTNVDFALPARGTR